MSTAILATPALGPIRRTTPRRTTRRRAAPELPVVVSATSMRADVEVRAMVRPSVPNYALRRLVVGSVTVVALLFGAIGAVGLMTGTGTSVAAATAGENGADAPARVHVAQAGDTLWSIANTYRGDVDRARFIDALIGLNEGVSIQAGQAIWLP